MPLIEGVLEIGEDQGLALSARPGPVPAAGALLAAAGEGTDGAGAALVLPTAAALAVFAGLGVGLALPFLLLGFVPALRRRLPRPGPWLGRLRRILSVPMFLTALGLAWVLGRQAGGRRDGARPRRRARARLVVVRPAAAQLREAAPLTLFFVIASVAKQSSRNRRSWIASSLRSSQ